MPYDAVVDTATEPSTAFDAAQDQLASDDTLTESDDCDHDEKGEEEEEVNSDADDDSDKSPSFDMVSQPFCVNAWI